MSDFALVYDHFDPGTEGLRESLTSTGNGYFCTRGTAEWEDAAGVHYPGTYVHGGFNRETTILGGRPVLNEDLVNLPNWLVLKLRIEGGEAIRLDNVELISYEHSYDIRLAMVQRVLRFRDRAGRETMLRSRRFVSMAHSHQAGIEWTLTPENWSGRVEVISGLDGRVTNQMVARYRELEGRHLDPVSPRTFGPETIALKVRTREVGSGKPTGGNTGRAPRVDLTSTFWRPRVSIHGWSTPAMSRTCPGGRRQTSSTRCGWRNSPRKGCYAPRSCRRRRSGCCVITPGCVSIWSGTGPGTGHGWRSCSRMP